MASCLNGRSDLLRVARTGGTVMVSRCLSQSVSSCLGVRLAGPEPVPTVDGIPCTTALRTVIDLAPELSGDELRRVVEDCLSRRLFTVDEAIGRIAEDDVHGRVGARLLGQALGRPSTD